MIPWLHIWLKSSPEYEAKLKKPYQEPRFTFKQLHSAVPKSLREKSLEISLRYVFRDWAMFALFLYLATKINPLGERIAERLDSPWTGTAVTLVLWPVYYWYQGLVLTGTWILGHEAGHGNLSPTEWVNDLLGYALMTPVLCPFFAWKFTHNMHHKSAASVEREENYTPKTRTQFMEQSFISRKWRLTTAFFDAFEDTPLFNTSILFLHQMLGWPAYMLWNASGRAEYPVWGTSHLNPWAALFKDSQKSAVGSSSFAVILTIAFYFSLGSKYGAWNMWRYFWVPWFMMNNFIVWCTFLQHSDPSVPYFRKSDWTFLKASAATVDRPLFGWQGKFFLHNFSHDHVVHHFFPDAPFYHGEEITKCIKPVMGEDYNVDTTPALYALWRSYTGCEYVDDEGGTVFWRDRYGRCARDFNLPPSSGCEKHSDP